MLGEKFSNRPSPFSPDHHPKRRSITEIAARREIESFRQGQLDMFCGLYSCINALRLALHDRHPISKTYAKNLYQKGMAYLDGKSAAGETAREGMGAGRQRYLLKHLAQCLKDDEGAEVIIERPFASTHAEIDNVFHWMEACINTGSPILVLLEGTHNHFTVIAGIDDRQLHLFDSTTLCRIRRAGCGTRQGTHIIRPGYLVSVQAAV